MFDLFEEHEQKEKEKPSTMIEEKPSITVNETPLKPKYDNSPTIVDEQLSTIVSGKPVFNDEGHINFEDATKDMAKDVASKAGKGLVILAGKIKDQANKIDVSAINKSIQEKASSIKLPEIKIPKNNLTLPKINVDKKLLAIVLMCLGIIGAGIAIYLMVGGKPESVVTPKVTKPALPVPPVIKPAVINPSKPVSIKKTINLPVVEIVELPKPQVQVEKPIIVEPVIKQEVNKIVKPKTTKTSNDKKEIEKARLELEKVNSSLDNLIY